MKIEIDTERDSEKELHAALRLIESLLGHRKRGDNESGGLMAGLQAVQSSPEEEEVAQPQRSRSLFSMFDAPAQGAFKDDDDDSDLKHYDDEVPEIEPY